tara:strand:+ start:45 stop:242 length:198 start_codon:yes stop_codon:yes gene_type:complete
MMEIICDSCKKEFELDSNKNYLGQPLDIKYKHNIDLLNVDIIGLCSVCYKQKLHELEIEKNKEDK